MSSLKQTVEKGKKSRFEGGDAKNYGRNYIRKQFLNLDMNRDLLKRLNVSHRVTEIDEQFSTEVPNLQVIHIYIDICIVYIYIQTYDIYIYIYV